MISNLISNLNESSFCLSSILGNKASTNNQPTFSLLDSSVNFIYPFQDEIWGNNEILSPDLLKDADDKKIQQENQ